MRICDDGHDEIVYDVRNCPMCRITTEKAKLEGEISGLQVTIVCLNNDINQLKEEVNNLWSKLAHLEQKIVHNDRIGPMI